MKLLYYTDELKKISYVMLERDDGKQETSTPKTEHEYNVYRDLHLKINTSNEAEAEVLVNVLIHQLSS